ncbi:glycosyltransferase [bacterium]|nr:glycosyltransferase [bacterium]
MNNKPFVSVIIAVYNGEKVIDECIKSLLTQDYPRDKYEIIIADNNSNDKTREVIKKYPVKYVMEDTIKGPSAARNTGAKVAGGEIFIFFDSDQIAEKSWLRKILQGWEYEKYGAFSGRNIYVDINKDLISDYWSGKCSKKVNRVKKGRLDSRFFAGGNIGIRKNIFEGLGGFDVGLSTCEDIDFALRMYKKSNVFIKYNDDAVAYHKQRTNIRSLLKREFWFGYGSVILERRHREVRKHFIIIRAILRTLLGGVALVCGFFKPMKTMIRKRHLQLILLDIAMRWSNCFGRVRAYVVCCPYGTKTFKNKK